MRLDRSRSCKVPPRRDYKSMPSCRFPFTSSGVGRLGLRISGAMPTRVVGSFEFKKVNDPNRLKLLPGFLVFMPRSEGIRLRCSCRVK